MPKTTPMQQIKDAKDKIIAARTRAENEIRATIKNLGKETGLDVYMVTLDEDCLTISFYGSDEFDTDYKEDE